MLGQLSDERVLYRTRKTVLEMLRDRGYEIGDGEIEESFEEFAQRYLNKPQMSFIAKRPSIGNDGVMTEEGEFLMEPILVKFATTEEKLGQDAIKSLVNFMDQYSKESSDKNKCKELYDAILIVKGGSTAIARKVSTLINLTNYRTSQTLDLSTSKYFLLKSF